MIWLLRGASLPSTRPFHLPLLSLIALVATTILSFVAAAQSTQQHVISFDLDFQPPKPMATGSYKGFPSRVQLFEQSSPPIYNDSVSPAIKTRTNRFTSREVTVDLLGGITKVGEYYTRIVVGGQPIRVQVDTGSSTLAFPVAECKNCPPSDQRYNPRLSTTGKQRWISCTNQKCARDVCTTHKCSHCSAADACCAVENPSACLFALKYGDGSGARGGLMVDEMSWGNVSAPVVFGAILTDTPNFERKMVDGILGMAYEALACNPTCVEPPFQQMVKAGVVDDQFTICITPHGGKLILGAFDRDLATSDLRYIPLALSSPPTFYTMNISSELTVGSRSLTLSSVRSGILDSGTTLIVVSENNFAILLMHLREYYCELPGLCDKDKTWFEPSSCVHLTDEQVNKLPTLIFHLGSDGSFPLELTAQDYMLRYKKANREYRCVGIMTMKAMQPGTDIILGNTVMQRYVTHYDRKNKRLGFAEAKPGCGGSTRCASYTQCAECAGAPGCSFDFRDGVCRDSKGDFGLVPYPQCSGTACFCRLGPRAGLVFGTITGFTGTVFVVVVVAFVVAVYQRRGSAGSDVGHSSDHAPLYSLGDEEEGDGMDEHDVSHFDQANEGVLHEKRYMRVAGN